MARSLKPLARKVLAAASRLSPELPGPSSIRSRCATVMRAAPLVGSFAWAASSLLKNAKPGKVDSPKTSPVERISGPSTGSTSGNMLKGKTDSLAPK